MCNSYYPKTSESRPILACWTQMYGIMGWQKIKNNMCEWPTHAPLHPQIFHPERRWERDNIIIPELIPLSFLLSKWDEKLIRTAHTGIWPNPTQARPILEFDLSQFKPIEIRPISLPYGKNYNFSKFKTTTTRALNRPTFFKY